MVRSIGFIEKVKINGKEVMAKIDTGANRNSVDTELAAEIGLGPIIGMKKFINAHGETTRPIVKGLLEIKDKKIRTSFNIFNRQRLRYRILIGSVTLKKCGFLIDPNKK
jgi:hypothetical protein